LALGAAPVRYAVRQVLDQEYQKNILVRENAARQARYKLGNPDEDESYQFNGARENRENRRDFDIDAISNVKRDFFGRVLDNNLVQPLQESDGNAGDKKKKSGKVKGKDYNKVWVSFHEGFSNAVRKPVTLEELLRGL
jgi:chromosome transmission fidelity protein 18